jgi:chromosome segregation protein
MYLKSLRVQGFKTFARKTELSFGRGITALVGPNGSGKSNLVDAVRWALGEKSARGLRGQRMEDVIFAGGPGKAPQGMAEVSLLIDNATGRVPLDFAEIEITRRMYRSGESDYFINGSRARLRDIEALLAHTGLTQDGYAIVAQNDIEYVIQAAPAVRRSLLEEAAGVRVLRSQHTEARQRLADARLNMQRAQDVLREILPRVEELRGQAERAEEARTLQAQLETLQGSLQLDRWRKAKQQLRKAEQRHRHLEDKLRERMAEADTVQGRYQALKAAAEAAQEARLAHQAELGRLRVEVTGLEGQRSLALERAASARAGRAEGVASLAQLAERAQAAAALAAQVEGETQTTQARILSLQEEREALARRAEAERDRLLTEASRACAQAKAALESATTEHRSLRAQRTASEAAHAVTEEELATARGAREAARAQLAALVTLRDRARPASASPLAAAGARRLRQVLEVDARFTAALEAALEHELDAWLAGSVADPAAAVRTLAERADARETLLFPVPEPTPVPAPAWAGRPAVCGAARHLVEAPAALRSLVDRLLAGVWIVEDLQTALELRETGDRHSTWVTRAGEVVTVDRFVGGKAADAVLKLEQEVRAAQRAQQTAAATLDTTSAARDQARITAQALDGPLQQAARAEVEAGAHLHHAEQRLAVLQATSPDHVLDAATNRRLALSTELSRYDQRQTHLQEQLRRIGEEQAQLQADRARLQERAAALQASEATAEADAAALQATITQREAALCLAEARDGEEGTAPVLYQQLRAEEEAHVQAQVAVAHAQDAVAAAHAEGQAAREAVAAAEADLPEVNRQEGEGEIEVDWQRTEREVGRLIRLIAALGPVNPLAPDEYRQAQERTGHLTEHVADLEGAIADLTGLMTRLKRDIEQRFEAVFQAVACNFQEYFTELFDGGRATLRLEAPPPDDELEEAATEPGVEILAQTPGKRLQALTLLSGGERALTALAFIFAVQRVNPSPFYVLDEVDAALDDANVNRFNKVLTRLAREQQFLIVTHNHSTMAQSEVLYGVTLGDHGISKMVSVRLTEVTLKLQEQTA